MTETEKTDNFEWLRELVKKAIEKRKQSDKILNPWTAAEEAGLGWHTIKGFLDGRVPRKSTAQAMEIWAQAQFGFAPKILLQGYYFDEAGNKHRLRVTDELIGNEEEKKEVAEIVGDPPLE